MASRRTFSKAAARKRLLEAEAKFKNVYMSIWGYNFRAVTTKDMEAVEKIVARCVKRLK